MIRVPTEPRENWQQKVENVGLLFHSPGNTYWNEGAYYRFTREQIDEIETATNTLHEMCLNAAQYVIDHDLFARFGIGPEFAEVIKAKWEEEPPAIYGRFDLAYDGVNPPKMLEYNADTPTSLVEASVVQWFWLQEKFGEQADQFNSIHERLIEKWKELKDYITEPLYFTYIEATTDGVQVTEDIMTIAYMRDTAEQAGIECISIPIDQIGWNPDHESFMDLEDEPMKSVFKLYPWEGMMYDEFAEFALKTADKMQWIEPAWKAILSNKAILPVLWDMYPGHQNLLAASHQPLKKVRKYVKKPILSREGANVTVFKKWLLWHVPVLKTKGDYGVEGHIYQECYDLPDFGGNRPVIGSWVIDGVAGGMGIRESDGLVSDNYSRFVPHMFV